MRNTTRYVLILLLGVFIGAAVTVEHAVRAEKPTVQDALAPLPLDELKTFAEVFSRIQQDYVEPVDNKKILEDAIQGMLSGLDPHSAYLDPEGYKEIRIGTEGQFGGLGIEVTMENGFVKVVTPIEDTPAAKAGLLTGDLIVRINKESIKGLSLNEAVRKMRGKPGTRIELTIVREGHDKPMDFTLERAVIKLQSVKRRLLEPGYGYVRITQFQGNSGKGLTKALRWLRTKNKHALKGLILDLRNNPGGVLPVAVSVADTFLNKGLIVYTVGRTSDSDLRYSATPGDALKGAPMVVLINGGSASASEIVAGALQDHHRAVIMGTRSFGKASVQTIIPMSNGGALKLTTARYYTPKGRSIQAEGIEPDIVTEEGKLTVAKHEPTLKEADLARHLKRVGKDKNDAQTAKESKDVTDGDFQLREALNLLKGITIMGENKGQ
ncbi:MAG: S41 family peptidase [Acidiferrobacteraceae bacterium]|jgi:carboxyl-terminal processing protease